MSGNFKSDPLVYDEADSSAMEVITGAHQLYEQVSQQSITTGTISNKVCIGCGYLCTVCV